MKVTKHTITRKSKRGKIILDNPTLEPHEIDAIFCLASFGFDVEALTPSNTPGSNNPDLLMLGTYWEMKSPTTTNERSIQTLFRKARKQSGGKAIFDLRNARKTDEAEIENLIMKNFKGDPGMRRIMIIRNNEEIVDFLK